MGFALLIVELVNKVPVFDLLSLQQSQGQLDCRVAFRVLERVAEDVHSHLHEAPLVPVNL